MFFRQQKYIRLICFSLLLGMVTIFLSSSALAASDTYKATLLDLVKKERYTIAYQKSKSIDDPVFQRLIEWFYLNNVERPIHSFEEVQDFLQATKGWPRRGKAVLWGEKQIIDTKSHSQVSAWFDLYKPTTQDALYLYVDFLRSNGLEEKALDMIRGYWRESVLSKKDRQAFYKKYKKDLRLKDHQARLDHLLWDGHFKSAEVLFPLVGKSLSNLARARIGLAKGKPGVDLMVQAVAPRYMNDEGLLYERVRWRRNRNMTDAAVELLNQAPDNLKNPKAWWRERHILARRYLVDKEYKKAYHVVSNHRQKSGFSHAQAEWLSGWISLQFLNKPEQAYDHFTHMAAKVTTPVSKSRGYYWQGLAAYQMGRTLEAYQYFAKASQYSTRFYAQLAYTRLQELSPDYPIPQLVSLGGVPQKKVELPEDILKICDWLYANGLKRETSIFFDHLVRYADDEDSFIYLFKLSKQYEAYHAQVMLAKKAMAKGFIALEEGYPFFDDLKERYLNGVEPALVYGVIRQESAFDPQARSSAGARGLMQLLPGTAKDMARKQNLSFSTKKLSQPEYNIRLGSRYLSYLLDRFDGYYVLAVAAYNAGPARIDNVIKKIGDPRSGDVDIVDWIEMIPIYETRNYIQRVLEGMHIYRAKLTQPISNDVLMAGEGD